MKCKDCLPLIPNYVDEELSEAQAAPLRQHLMDCRLCRKALLGEKAFKRWFDFEVEPEVAIPAGFAARVARRAFAGDLGSEVDSGFIPAAKSEPETPILQFILRATAIAAGLLLVISVLTFSTRLPDGSSLHALTLQGKEQILRELDGLEDPSVSPGTEAVEDGESGFKDMSRETDPELEQGPQ